MNKQPTKQSWRNPNRPAWGNGPWDAEPDKQQWVDEATGLDCLAVRVREHGGWCGYVGVPVNHPWYATSYRRVFDRITVHGGLTFSDSCMKPIDDQPWRQVCHAGRPEVWWFGFDCAHGFDVLPNENGIGVFRGLSDMFDGMTADRAPKAYRDLAYVESQCAGLARQLAEVPK